MKHRNIFLTASIVLILSMTACGQSEPKETDAAQTTELESELESESESESETEKETKKSSKKDEDKTEETKKTASTTKPSSESTSSTSNSKPSSGSTSSTSNSKPSSGSTSGTSSSKPSSGSTSSSTSKPSTGNSESTSKPSVPETEAPHVHNWVEITHVEDQGCNVPIYGDWTYMGVSCNGCGTVFDSVYGWEAHASEALDNHNTACAAYTEVWDKPITGYEWAEDLVTVSDGWQCSSCGATK